MLKNHGKKISVILLAIALMISPLLLTVKAAEDCGTHTNVYLFSQAERLIQKDIEYKAYSDHSKAISYETLNSASLNKKLVKIGYTDVYLKAYGWTTAKTNSLKTDYDLSKISVEDPKGSEKFLNTEESYTHAVESGEVLEGEHLTDVDSGIPDEATILNDEFINYWDDEMVNAMMELELLNLYTTEDSMVPFTKGDTTYYMHKSWKEIKDSTVDIEGSKETVITSKLRYMYENKIAYPGNVDYENFIAMYKNAQLKGVSTTGEASCKGGISGSKDCSVIKFDVTRSATSTNYQNSFGSDPESKLVPISWLYYTDGGGSAKYVIEKNDGTKEAPNYKPYFVNDDGSIGDPVSDTDKIHQVVDYWYFLPAAEKVTYDLGECVVDTTENSGGSNPDTGVVSYAIIGTLLVGAASAYIYARKNNKFNKV